MHTGFWWEKPKGKIPLGRPSHRWEDNIKKNEMGVACSTYGGEERCVEGFGGKPEGKILLFEHNEVSLL